MLSASEIVPSYRNFCDLNYPGKFLHFYSSIEEQAAGSSCCCFCKGGLQDKLHGFCDPLANDGFRDTVQVLFSGSPCDPFSQQRAKRFGDGSVASHYQFDTTMRQVCALYMKYEPEVGVFEQVFGFTMPFVKGGTETPKQRPVVDWVGRGLQVRRF